MCSQIACHWTLSWIRWVYSTSAHHISLRPTLTFPPICAFVFQVISSLQSFRLKFCIHLSPQRRWTGHVERSVEMWNVLVPWSRVILHNLALRLTLFRIFPFVWLGFCNCCSLAFFLLSDNFEFSSLNYGLCCFNS